MVTSEIMFALFEMLTQIGCLSVKRSAPENPSIALNGFLWMIRPHTSQRSADLRPFKRALRINNTACSSTNT